MMKKDVHVLGLNSIAKPYLQKDCRVGPLNFHCRTQSIYEIRQPISRESTIAACISLLSTPSTGETEATRVFRSGPTYIVIVRVLCSSEECTDCSHGCYSDNAFQSQICLIKCGDAVKRRCLSTRKMRYVCQKLLA